MKDKIIKILQKVPDYTLFNLPYEIPEAKGKSNITFDKNENHIGAFNINEEFYSALNELISEKIIELKPTSSMTVLLDSKYQIVQSLSKTKYIIKINSDLHFFLYHFY